MPGGGGVGGQEEGVGQQVGLVGGDRLEIQHAGDEQESVEVNAESVAQVIGQPGGAGGAVAFAREKFGGHPAVVAGQVEPDELAHRLDVPAQSVELLGVLALLRPAVAGADRVNENQVGLVEQGVGVLDQATGGRGRISLVVEPHALGAKTAQMQPDRGGAGASVEAEGDGAGGGVGGILQGIGDVEHLGAGLGALLLGQQREKAGRDLVGQLAARQGDLMGGRLVVGLFLLFLLFLLLLFLRRRRLFLLFFRAENGEEQRTKQKQGAQAAGVGHGDPRRLR